MLKKLFSNLGKRGPEGTAISGQLIIPTTYDVTTHVRPIDSTNSNIIDPEDTPIPHGTKLRLYEVGPQSRHRVNIHGSIISPEEPVQTQLIIPQQITYTPGELTNEKLGLQKNTYPKVRRPGC